jgi:hypothetical protein
MAGPVRVELQDPEAILRGAGQEEGLLSRAGLFRKAALTGSAVIGGGLLVSNVPAAFAQGDDDDVTDVEILNLILLNESLEVAFYTEALARAGLTGRPLAFARQVRDNEVGHRDLAATALGTQARPIPPFAFGEATATEASFLATALALENNDVGFGNGAGPLIRSRALLAVAGQLVSVEARQAAWIRRIVYGPGFAGGAAQYPAPVAFDVALTPAQAVAALRTTGFVQGQI